MLELCENSVHVCHFPVPTDCYHTIIDEGLNQEFDSVMCDETIAVYANEYVTLGFWLAQRAFQSYVHVLSNLLWDCR